MLLGRFTPSHFHNETNSLTTTKILRDFELVLHFFIISFKIETSGWEKEIINRTQSVDDCVIITDGNWNDVKNPGDLIDQELRYFRSYSSRGKEKESKEGIPACFDIEGK